MRLRLFTMLCHIFDKLIRVVWLKFVILIVALVSRQTDVECPRRGQTWLAPREAQPKRGVGMMQMT
jgi:hypothetical protein